ncbi:MAG: hypothetical protein AAF633_10970 [Chloroflexota bacterium]
MSDIKRAWDAIKQGDRLKAQEITAHILKDDPRNAEAWMLLGEAVSGDRQVLFYKKALQLNPDLDAARQRLLEIEQNQKLGITTGPPPTLPLPINSGPPDVPEGVELDAPTVPLADRLAAEKSSPKTQSTAAMEARSKTAASQPVAATATAPAEVNGVGALIDDNLEKRNKGATASKATKSNSTFDTNSIWLIIVLLCMIFVLYLLYLNIAG